MVPAEDRLISRMPAGAPIPIPEVRILPHGTVQLIKGGFQPKTGRKTGE